VQKNNKTSAVGCCSVCAQSVVRCVRRLLCGVGAVCCAVGAVCCANGAVCSAEVAAFVQKNIYSAVGVYIVGAVCCAVCCAVCAVCCAIAVVRLLAVVCVCVSSVFSSYSP